MMGESTVRRGLMTEEQRDDLYEALTEAAERGALHMSVTMFAVVAHRPVGPVPGVRRRPACGRRRVVVRCEAEDATTDPVAA